MKIVLAALFCVFSAAQAAAAPMWVERLAAPKAALVDSRFLTSAEGSDLRLDHSQWAAFLSRFVVIGDDGVARVRYSAARGAGKAQLDEYVASLEAADVAALSRREQLAFWINLYNAATVRLILEHPGVSSIRDIDKPWDQPVAVVSGRSLTLNSIEHGVIRPVFGDPRIHYAVNCASLGCPNLAWEAYAGAHIDAQLDAAAAAFVNHPRGVSIANGRLKVSKIYGWYRGDFGEDAAAAIAHLRRFADQDLAAALDGREKFDAFDYDWRLNSAD